MNEQQISNFKGVKYNVCFNCHHRRCRHLLTYFAFAYELWMSPVHVVPVLVGKFGVSFMDCRLVDLH
jgi:hypothetical protein